MTKRVFPIILVLTRVRFFRLDVEERVAGRFAVAASDAVERCRRVAA